MRRKRLQVSFLLAATLGVASAGEDDGDARFNRFCNAHFAMEQEEELVRLAGKELKTAEGSEWRHVSERSACVAWQTSLPATTFVEYGPTKDCGQVTDEPERPLFTHVHTLRGLEPGAAVHYRLVCIDTEGHRHPGPLKTLTTPRLADAIRIPGDLAGPPYVLDKPNATYLVTEDIAADGTAIFIAASGITLDLGGHTVTYDGKRDTANQGACGVRGHKSRGIGLRGVKVVNGTIRQGKGGSSTRKLWDTLYNPLFLSKPVELELAGLTLDYGGEQVVGIALLLRGERIDVHHNVIVDRGTTIFNRHVGIDALFFHAAHSACHHNLIERTRHRGIHASSDSAFHDNEVYIDSHATNSYGIMLYGRDQRNVTIRGNRIFGTGYHPIGIGSYQGCCGVRVEANYIRMQAASPEGRWRGGQGGGDDPNQLHPVNGIRLQSPGKNIVHTGNTVVVKGRGKGAMMRGLWMVPGEASGPGLVFTDNRIKLIAEDNEAEGYALSCGGHRQPRDDATVRLAGNVVITNLCHAQFGDNYSHGGRYLFQGSRFIKVGDDPRYRTIRLGWRGWKYESYGHTFIDTAFEGGAGYDSVSFDGTQRGRYEFAVAWTLTIETEAGAAVSVRDATDAEVLSTAAPPDGRLPAVLAEYVVTREGKARRTPHTVTVTKGGKRATKPVTMDANKTLSIRP